MDASIQKRSVVIAPPQAGRDSDEQLPSHGARALHAALDQAIGQKKFGHVEIPEANVTLLSRALEKISLWNLNVRRGLKVAAALALLIGFGALPLRSLLRATSVEAVLNGRIVTLRSPIEGDVIAAPSDFTRWSAVKDVAVLHIHNPNAESSRVSDLRHQIARLDDEREIVVTRLERARQALSLAEAQTETFAQGRIRQLESRVAALEGEVEGTIARAEEAQASYGRLDSLASRGVSSTADLLRARRDMATAAAAQRAANARVQETKIELDAVRHGSFLGDSYNDRPSSAQRADEIQQRIDDLSSDLAGRTAERSRYVAELAQESRRLERLSDADVSLPVNGRIWEVLVSPGERVRQDQDLLRVLDCSASVVTADVEESVYNQLQVGAPARFRPSDGGPDVPGTIVNLTGMTGVAGNFAIQPQSRIRQVYHVTVSVPTDAQTCSIGRTGSIFFERGQSLPSVSHIFDLGLRR